MSKSLLSATRLRQLRNQICLMDTEEHQRHQMGYMSLELGKRSGLVSGYPVLVFAQHKNDFNLSTKIPYDNEYDQNRDTTIEEMVTFVLVAKSKFPDERMTKELEKHVKQKLASQILDLQSKARELKEYLILISK